MAFVADPISLRTHDPIRGFELFKTSSELDGKVQYNLHRSDGVDIVFHTRASPSRIEDWLIQNPSLPNTIFHFVKSPRGRLPNRSRNQTDSIIREALTAYRADHGLPKDGKVVVLFD